MISLSDVLNPRIDFDALEIKVWNLQVAGNPVMKKFCSRLGDFSPVFPPVPLPVPIPIRFFRDFNMMTGEWIPEITFLSSGTTSAQSSRQPVFSLNDYRQVVLKGFLNFFGAGQWKILALLPNYLEKGDSSLVQMVKFLIEECGLPGSGFYLDNIDELKKAIYEAEECREPIMLFGVTFALLDFSERFNHPFPEKSVIIETGGMKGRRKEMTRDEIHKILRDAFRIKTIHSEYGMTELLSQAWSAGNGLFHCPPWMKVRIVDPYLPTREVLPGLAGRIAVTDLANFQTCAFILTDDLGRMNPDGSFEVLGRLDYSELRGCNLLYE